MGRGGGCGGSTSSKLLQQKVSFSVHRPYKKSKVVILACSLIPHLLVVPPGVHAAAAESRPNRPQLPLRLLRHLLLPGVHGAVRGVFLPSGGGHVHGPHLRVGVTTPASDQTNLLLTCYYSVGGLSTGPV